VIQTYSHEHNSTLHIAQHGQKVCLTFHQPHLLLVITPLKYTQNTNTPSSVTKNKNTIQNNGSNNRSGSNINVLFYMTIFYIP